MTNLMGIDSLTQYANKLRENIFPSLENQKYKSLGEFSSDWNTFVYFESARAAEQIGYGFHPLAFLNDVLYT
ncbi:hypothetical protein GW796_08240 [archaeon]|jgi:hypothetical protein|nr:hypothetical protein [archaeon]